MSQYQPFTELFVKGDPGSSQYCDNVISVVAVEVVSQYQPFTELFVKGDPGSGQYCDNLISVVAVEVVYQPFTELFVKVIQVAASTVYRVICKVVIQVAASTATT